MRNSDTASKVSWCSSQLSWVLQSKALKASDHFPVVISMLLTRQGTEDRGWGQGKLQL